MNFFGLYHSPILNFLLRFFFLLFLIFLNGYFVVCEFALVSIRRTSIDILAKKGNKKAQLLQHALDNLPTYISATQFGITLISIALGSIGEPAIADILEPFFHHYLPSQIIFFTSYTIAITLAFIFISFFQIVLGELVPKTIALQYGERIALRIILPLTIFMKFFRPFIWIINISGRLILRMLHIPITGSRRQTLHTEEEIKMILSQSALGGVIDKEEVEMVYKIFRLDDTPVRQIMIPLKKVISFELDTPIEIIIQQIKKSRHSRYPIYAEVKENVIGMVHIKDIYTLALKGHLSQSISNTKVLRTIMHIPALERADDVLLQLREKRVHMAAICDEKGDALGILTLEDIVKNIVGEIRQEIELPLKVYYDEKKN